MLTLPDIVAASAGLTLSGSTFIAAVQVADFMVGDAAWLAILVGGLLCITAALCFAELNSIIPSAAGLRLYFSHAYNDLSAIIVSMLYMLIVLGVIGTESYVLAMVLNEAWPAVHPLVWILAMFSFVTVLNVLGIKIAGGFQNILTYALIVSLLIFAVIALVKVNFQFTSPLNFGSGTNLTNAVALGVFLFVGFEWVTPLAEEASHHKLISKGMLLAVGILSITYALFTLAMTAATSREALSGSPIPHLVFARDLLGPGGTAWMMAITLAASITTFNAGLLSVSRFVYSSAREHVLPAVLSRLSTRFFTPWAAIVAIFIVAVIISAVVLSTQHYLTLVNMAAAMESIIYAMAGIAVIRLRKKMPHIPRPNPMPGGNVIPIVCSIVFTVLALAVFISFPEVFLYIAFGLLLCTAYVYLVVPKLKRRYQSKKAKTSNRRRAES